MRHQPNKCACGQIHNQDKHYQQLLNQVKVNDALGTNLTSPIPRPNTSGSSATTRQRGPKFFPWEKPIPVNTRDIHRELRKYTDPSEKRIARWLFSTWTAQADDIKFQELDNALITGQLSTEIIGKWREDYQRVVNEVLDPEWRLGVSEAADYSASKIADALGVSWQFPETTRRIESWIDEHGAALAVGFSAEQELAVRNIIRRSIVDEGLSTTELAKRLRPVIGLTDFEATAVDNRRKHLERLVAKGKLRANQVDRTVQRYSNRLLRQRATRISRTETAQAFNFGALEGMREAIDQGVAVTIAKQFSTSADERVCPFCGPLDGKVIGLEQTFPGQTKLVPNTLVPPVHPMCRCGVEYIVVDDIRRPVATPPLGEGMTTVQNFGQADNFVKQYKTQIAASGENTAASREVLRALELGDSLPATVGGGRPNRLIVNTTKAGEIRGAVRYTASPDGVWKLYALGFVDKDTAIGKDLFGQYIRDTAAHGGDLAWTPAKGMKSFFKRLGFTPDEAGDYIVRNRAAYEWMQRNKFSVAGKPINRVIPKSPIARPKTTPLPDPDDVVKTGTAYDNWEPVTTRQVAIKKLEEHYKTVNVGPTALREFGSEERLVAGLNAVDAEIVRLKSIGALPTDVKISTLSFQTNPRSKFNGRYKHFRRARDDKPASAHYTDGDVIIHTRTAQTEHQFPEAIVGSQSREAFTEYVDTSKIALREVDPSEAAQRFSARNAGQRFSTSDAVMINTLRHELGHAVSIPLMLAEGRPAVTTRLWRQFESKFTQLVGHRRKYGNQKSIVADVVSQYATYKPTEMYAEMYAMVYAEGFKEGALDAALGLQGMEKLVKDIAKVVQE